MQVQVSPLELLKYMQYAAVWKSEVVYVISKMLKMIMMMMLMISLLLYLKNH